MLANNQFDKILNYINVHNLSILATKRQYFQKIWIRRSTESLLCALAQYSGLILADLHSNSTFIWLSVGITLGLFFLRGSRIFLGIWLGSLLYLIPTNWNEKIIWIILLHTLGPHCMYWLFTKTRHAIIPLSRLQSLWIYILITFGFSIFFGFLHNGIKNDAITNVENVLAYYLSFLLFTPISLLWDHDSLRHQYFLPKQRMFLTLNLVCLLFCGGVFFSYSIQYSGLFFLGIFLCILIAFLRYGQWGGVILGIQLGILLIVLPEMPIYTPLKNSLVYSSIQLSGCISIMFGLAFSTFKKEKYFKNYLIYTQSR